METLLRIVLSNAVAATLLALLAGTAACVWRRPALLHALWLLVLVKLVTPPLVWVRIPWPTVAPTTEVVAAETAPVAPDFEPAAETPGDFADPDSSASGGRKPPDLESSRGTGEESGGLRPPPAEEKASLPVPNWQAIVLAVWLAGSAGWYALALYRLRRFRRLLRHAGPAPESLRQRTQRLAQRMRLRRPPAVWLVPGRVAPMLWAAGNRPRILLPSELLGRLGLDQQNALLAHELAHLRRRDHWVRWLEFAAAGLYWWHPVLWFARRELREAEEQCCDAWVTSTLPGAGKTYATALLETLEFLSDAPPAVPSLASGVGRVADLKRRLTMILSGKTPRALGWRGCLTVLGLGALALPLLPAWAQAQPADKPQNKLPEPVVVGGPDGSAAVRRGEPSPGEMEARAELKAAEAQLEQKQAETAALMAKVRMLQAKVQAGHAGAGAGGMTVRIGEGNFEIRLVGPEDGNPDALKDLLKRLQSMLPEATQATVLDKKTGKILMRVEGGHAEPAPPTPPLPQHIIMVPLDRLAGAAGPGAGAAGPTPAASTDQRIDELEQRLKGILHEVEKLRREREERTPGSGAGAPAGAAPALNIVPNLNWTFTIDPKAATRAERERAMAEKAAAERAAAEDRVKRLEEEIRQLKKASDGAKP